LNGQAEPLIRVVDLVRRYKMGNNVVAAVNGISFVIERGCFAAIIGASGSGKSTLLNLLGGLERPTSGQLWVAGQDIARARSGALNHYRQRVIGFIFQSFNLLSTRTAWENVELPLMIAGSNAAQRRLRARELLTQVGLSHRLDHRPNILSGGEQQRVAIARALANQPAILLADEPTGNLDSKTGAEVLALLRGLNREQNLTMILVTHDPKVASYADQVIQMRDGSIVEGVVS